MPSTTPSTPGESPTRTELEVREAGVGEPLPPPVGELPAGGAVWAVPPHLTHIALINQFARAYHWTQDEAVKHSRVDAARMLNDVEIADALDTRLLATVQLSWHLEAQDETDPKQMDAVKKLTGVIERTPHFQDLLKSLLLATWYGRAGCALIYEWNFSAVDGERMMLVKRHYPINGDSLVARYDGSWGQLVNANFSGPKETSGRGYAHFYSAAEKEAVLIHSHDPFSPDFYDSELAGQIMGHGLRGRVFWFWYISNNLLSLLCDYSERFSLGIWKGYYEQTNDSSKQALAESLANYRANRVLELPRRADGQATADVEIVDVGTATPAFIFETVQWMRQAIRRYITGSALTGEKSVNIGGDGISASEDQISRVTKYDAERLAATLTEQFVPVLCRYNCGPHVPPPRFVFDIDRPNSGELLAYAKLLMDMGSTVDLDHLHSVAGVPRGDPGGNVASKLQPMSPVAVAQQPIGVPQAGPAGPQPVQPQFQPQLQPDTSSANGQQLSA